ncbi:helix-turn-helix transcriptional regulator [Listeria sp. PSOL-1]|uniref:helix-turn-helix transcriptional regulator n=1 Tax=Listeria sp. PSOL-1 TaxID=1844999 RepID=UPI0013D0CA56|nr:helix-turn-helix transcriptional regulator [Listeria sp. PSOL-1]
MNDNGNTQTLGAFLREARNRITPRQIGLLPNSRRRTPGLRREEVAQLANIGVSWYTAIEQGKNVHPSNNVLEALADALLLSTSERQYLFSLATGTKLEKKKEQQTISIGLKQIVDSLDPDPAYIIDEYWDILIWNKSAEFVFHFHPYDQNVHYLPNLLRHFLTDPFMVALNGNSWEKRAKVMIARYRADRARYPQDDKAQQLIEELEQTSSLFKKTWIQQKISIASNSKKIFMHPEIGLLECEQSILQTPDNPSLSLRVFTTDKTLHEIIRKQLHQ